MELSQARPGDLIEQLYAERYAAFYRMALAVVRDADSAHDVVQDGFARALAEHARFRGEGSLAGWVSRIIFRASLDRRRAARRLLLVGEEGIAETWTLELPFPDRDPELDAALRALAPKQRLVVFLRYFADLALDEIAELTSTSSGTVSATLAQAKSRLARRLTSPAYATREESSR